MAVQEDVVRRAVGWHHEDRRHAVRTHLSIGDALRLGRELMESFGYVPPELEAVSQPEPAGHVGVEVCVLREFRAAHRTTPFRCESCSRSVAVTCTRRIGDLRSRDSSVVQSTGASRVAEVAATALRARRWDRGTSRFLDSTGAL